MSVKNLIHNSAWSALNHIFERATLLLASVILSNYLANNSYAAYNYFVITISMVSSYASLGLGVTTAKYFAEAASGKRENTRFPLGTLWLASLVLGAIASFAIMVLPSSWIGASLSLPIYLYSIGVMALAFSIIPGAGIVGLEQFKASAIWGGMLGLVMLLGALFAGVTDSLYMAVFVFLFVTIAKASVHIAIIHRRIGLSRITEKTDISWDALLKILDFAGPMFIVTLMTGSVVWLLGRLLLEQDDGEYQFSLFSIGMQWLSLSLFLPGMITKAFFPYVVKDLAVHNNIGRISRLLWKASMVSFIVGGLIVIALTFTGKYLIRFYGDLYYDEYWLIGVYALAALPMAPVVVLGNAVLAADGQYRWVMTIGVWFFLVLLFAWMLRHRGALGMAEAYGASATVFLGLALLTYRRTASTYKRKKLA